MDPIVWLVLAVIAVVGIVAWRRRGARPDGGAEPETTMRLELERAKAVEALARSGPTGDNPHA